MTTRDDLIAKELAEGDITIILGNEQRVMKNVVLHYSSEDGIRFSTDDGKVYTFYGTYLLHHRG